MPQKKFNKKPPFTTPFTFLSKKISIFLCKNYGSLHIVPRTTIWQEASMDSLAQVSVGGLAQVAVRRQGCGRTFVQKFEVKNQNMSLCSRKLHLVGMKRPSLPLARTASGQLVRIQELVITIVYFFQGLHRHSRVHIVRTSLRCHLASQPSSLVAGGPLVTVILITK